MTRVAAAVVLLALVGVVASCQRRLPVQMKGNRPQATPAVQRVELAAAPSRPETDGDPEDVTGTYHLWRSGGFSHYLELREDGTFIHYQTHYLSRFRDTGVWRKDDRRVVLLVKWNKEHGTYPQPRREVLTVVSPGPQDGRHYVRYNPLPEKPPEGQAPVFYRLRREPTK